MNASAIIARLGLFPSALRAAVSIATPEDARWKPAPEHWSILEISCHLLDEEREDFRSRLRSTLAAPSAAWPPLILDGIAEKRRYNERDLTKTLDEFAQERSESVAWLRSLTNIDWRQAYVHPKAGPVTAGDLLSSWTAHDALHLRQIAKRIYGLASRDAGTHSTRYAGDWTA